MRSMQIVKSICIERDGQRDISAEGTIYTLEVTAFNPDADVHTEHFTNVEITIFVEDVFITEERCGVDVACLFKVVGN